MAVNYKVVETKKGYELVSYMHKDLTHYAIREVGDDELYDVTAPTKELMGWDLRKVMIKKLESYASPTPNGETPQFAKVSTATMNVLELEEGMVLTYNSGARLGTQKFNKIYRLGTYLVFCVDPNGIGTYWQYDALQDRLDKGIIKVLRSERVPEGLKFPDEPYHK